MKLISKLKLEHQDQQILPLPHFLFRLGRYALFAVALILISVAFGTLGYWHFAGLSLLDSFHMACMILTGMGPVSTMESSGAKIFSSLYALYSGVAFLSIVAVFFAPIVHRLLHILHVDNNEK